MSEPLIELFVRARSSPIEIDGLLVHASYSFDDLSATSAALRVSWVSAVRDPTQGIMLIVEGGLLEVAGQRAKRMVLWHDNSPDVVDVLLSVSGRRSPRLVVYNVWRTAGGQLSSSLGNAGMLVEKKGNRTTFRCSDGVGPVDFDDLVFVLQGSA